MKHIQAPIEIQRDGIVDEQSFGIEDIGMVLSILRSKLYGDPLLAIVREYVCNARDAHREVNKRDVPIRVSFPSFLDPNFRVIDDGPGIDPDRMSKVFTKFAASTKRDTNDQVGYFGIGAKCAWALADAFQIITRVAGKKRTYSAYIDETNVGKLALLSTIDTDECNGTEIVVPIKEEHFRDIRGKFNVICASWDVAPHVLNQDYTFPKPIDTVMSGNGWRMVKNHYGDRFYGKISDVCIMIDGIAYEAYGTLKSEVNDNVKDPVSFLYKFNNVIMIVDFPNGELQLAANREGIHWDHDTKKKALQRLAMVALELQALMESKIATAETYIDACVLAENIATSAGFNLKSNQLFWRGVPIVNSIASNNIVKNAYICKYRSSYTADNTVSPSCVKADRGRKSRYSYSDYVSPRWNVCVVVNDTHIETVSPIRAAQIFSSLPKTIDKLVVVHESILSSSTFQKISAHIPYVRFSDFVPKREVKAEADKPAVQQLKARKLIYRYKGGSWNLSSWKDFDSTTAVRLYTFLTRNQHSKNMYSNHNSDLLSQLRRNHDAVIYGIDKVAYDRDPETFKEVIENATEVMAYVKTILDKVDYASAWPYELHIRDILDYASRAEWYEKLLPYVGDHADLKRYLELSKHMKSLATTFENVRTLVSAAGIRLDYQLPKPVEFDEVKKLAEKFDKKYPLLSYISNDYFFHDKLKAHAKLIRVIDEEPEEPEESEEENVEN